MTYLIVSNKLGLNQAQQSRFVQFMNKRYAGQENAVCMGGIAERWANIIKIGKEIEYASAEEKLILSAIPKVEVVVLPKVAPVAPVAQPIIKKVAAPVKETVKFVNDTLKSKKGKKKK